MATDPAYYEGPVCYADGWHWSVEADEADKKRRVALAQVSVDHAPDAGAKQAAEDHLAEVEAHPHDAPGQRLVLEDRFIGSDGETYTGPVEHSPEGALTTEDGKPLSIETRYRFATDGDRSWHDRKHRRFVAVDLGGGEEGGGLAVTPEDFAAIKEFLAERKGGQQ